MTYLDRQWLVAALLVALVGLLWSGEVFAEKLAIVDCEAGRCVLMPIEDAAKLAATVSTCEARLDLCRDELTRSRERLFEAVEDCAAECSREVLACPEVPACAECGSDWVGYLVGGAIGVGVGIVIGAFVVGL